MEPFVSLTTGSWQLYWLAELALGPLAAGTGAGPLFLLGGVLAKHSPLCSFSACCFCCPPVAFAALPDCL